MVGGWFSKPQGPQAREKREHGLPSQRQPVLHEDFCSADAPAYGVHHLAQKREGRLRRIQAAEPSAQGRGIRHAIRIFDRGRGSFPGVTVQKVPSQRLAARDQAVVAIRRRERRQEGERLAAQIAHAPANRNPVMIFVVGLFAATAMTDDRVAQANGALAQDRPPIRVNPIGFQIALRWRK